MLQPTAANAAMAIEETDADGVLSRATGTSDAAFVAGAWGANQSAVGDFGMVTQFNIGDRVWLDMQPNDGLQSAAETGIAGVEVQLLDAATGAVLVTTTTDADGLWHLNSLRDALAPQTSYVLSIPIADGACRPAADARQPGRQRHRRLGRRAQRGADRRRVAGDDAQLGRRRPHV